MKCTTRIPFPGIFLSPSVILTIIIYCCIISCKKNGSSPSAPPPPPPLGSMKIDLVYRNQSPTPTNFELIISETGGKILLDTVAPVNTPIAATLGTNATLVDLTTIAYLSPFDTFFVYTYKGVNPSAWQTSIINHNFPEIATPPYVQKQILFINTPPYSTPVGSYYKGYMFADFVAPGDGAAEFATNTLYVSYDQFNNNYDYLLFPQFGLYNFHMHSPNALDTVDLTHMDTAVNMAFNYPSQYVLAPCALLGFMDTTDLSNTLLLYGLGQINPQAPYAALEYPKKYVQKYYMTATGTTSNNDFALYTTCSPTIPATLPFPDETYYTLSSRQNDNFAVTFGATTRPSAYTTTWTAAKTIWMLYASPDSTVLHPQSLINALNSQLLKGQDLSNISLQSFGFDNLHNLSYPAYFSYLCDTDMIRTQWAPTDIQFNKNF